MEQIVKADYVQAVMAIKQAIQVSRYRISRHANGESLGLYYGVGKYISEHSRNAVWGTGAIEHISNQLQQEMPGLKGFSAENMRKMRLFYEAWVDVFENRSAVPNNLGVMPITSFIDLLFYHRRMRCMVAIELKNGEFQPEYAGKLNFYLLALDEYVKLPDENPSIGIILCRDKSNTEVEFTLRDMSKPLGVATYRSVDELPEQYRALPSVDELRELM